MESMTREPHPAIQSVVARYARAWADGDLRRMIDCYHDDVTFHYFGLNPFAGTHRGKVACLAVLQAFAGKTKRKLITIEDVLIGNSFAAIVALEEFERQTQLARLHRLFRYAVRDDKLFECWVYDQDQRLVDAMLS